MAAYKDKKTNTWYTSFYYLDWKGNSSFSLCGIPPLLSSFHVPGNKKRAGIFTLQKSPPFVRNGLIFYCSRSGAS